MSGGRRIKRLNAQFQREVSTLLRRQASDPRIQGVTVTRVAVTPDISIARIFVRHLQGPDHLDEALEGLEAAGPWLRRALGQELHLRRIPELEFMEDTSLEQAMRIEKILHEVRPDDGWEEADPDEASSPEDDEEERG